MLQNAKIGARLFLLVGSLSILMVVIGVLGLYGLSTTVRALGSVVADLVIPLEQFKVVSDAYGKHVPEAASKLRDSTVTWGQAAVSIDESLSKKNDRWNEHMATKLTQTEERLSSEAKTEMQRADQAIARLRGIIQTQDRPGLIAFLKNDYYPAIDPLNAKLDELVKLQLQEASQEHQSAIQRYALIRMLFIAALLAGILLAVLYGRSLINDIAKPLAQIQGAAETIASGDLNYSVPVRKRTDEISALSHAFTRMGTNLSELIGQVQRSGIQVNTSATEIAATAREQQATANEIAATTSEIGATAKEISATSKELVKTMDEVTEVAERTGELAGSGQVGLTRIESTMGHIMEAAASINQRLAVLSEKAGNINTVVTTIAKVADQTNLLSLNAAIEAEKAGEYGRGFSVVATEIRRLADQTAIATTDIETMVKEMQSAVSAGVMGMDKFSDEVRRGVETVQQAGAELTQIIQQVQSLPPRFERVGEGMQSQSEGAQQISETLGQLGEAARQTAESLTQSTLAIEQLNDAARGLQSGVSRFTLKS